MNHLHDSELIIYTVKLVKSGLPEHFRRYFTDNIWTGLNHRCGHHERWHNKPILDGYLQNELIHIDVN